MCARPRALPARGTCRCRDEVRFGRQSGSNLPPAAMGCAAPAAAGAQAPAAAAGHQRRGSRARLACVPALGLRHPPMCLWLDRNGCWHHATRYEAQSAGRAANTAAGADARSAVQGSRRPHTVRPRASTALCVTCAPSLPPASPWRACTAQGPQTAGSRGSHQPQPSTCRARASFLPCAHTHSRGSAGNSGSGTASTREAAMLGTSRAAARPIGPTGRTWAPRGLPALALLAHRTAARPAL